MELSTAIHLIERGILNSNESQRWADLGAGNGLFTRALGSLLPINSSIVAVDQNAAALKSIQWDIRNVSLTTQVDNFASITWGEDFDGILMANALHYVKDQIQFLTKAKTKLSPVGRILIVEYERQRANSWVPYPITFAQLKEMAMKVGFSHIEKLEEVPSIYDRGSIYSSILAL